MSVIFDKDILAAFDAEDAAILAAPIDTGANAVATMVRCPATSGQTWRCKHEVGPFIDADTRSEGPARDAVLFHVKAASASDKRHRVFMDNHL